MGGLGTSLMFATSPRLLRFLGMVTPNKNPLTAPERRYPHHRAPDTMLNNSLIIVTVCSRNRAQVLANDNVHQILHSLWSDGRHWRVGAYVIMPDHVHLIVMASSSNSVPLERWISWWKRESTLLAKQYSVRWQKNFWDRRIRNEENYGEKIAYIRNNPVRHNLVLDSREWRFQGEIYKIG